MAHKKSKKIDSPFWITLKRFIDHTEGLEKSLFAVELMSTLLISESRRIQDFIDRKGKSIKRSKGTTTFIVAPEDASEYKKLRRERNSSEVACKTLPRSLFISAVSEFDIFIGSLVKTILNIQPNIISPERALTFANIKGFKTIKDAVNHLIDEEIEALLFNSHVEQLEWLGKRTGINFMEKLSNELPTFIELTERRNLYVHSDGVINNKYITQCKKNNVSLPESYKKDTELVMSPEYFRFSMDCLYQIATKISFLMWKKYKSSEIVIADEFFNDDIAIHTIKSKKYKLAENLLAFARTEFRDSTEEMKKVFLINLALAIKLDKRKEESSSLINSIDWTACSDELRLGVIILNEDYKEAFKLMQKIGRDGKFISKNSYEDDPIFEDLRRQKEFGKFFKKIYGKKPTVKREILKINKN